MPYTPIETLVGGYLLHLSSSFLLSDTGKVFGISGIVSQALLGPGPREKWRWAVIIGLVAGPIIGEAVGLEGTYASDAIAGWKDIVLGRGVIAGALVGLGSKLGSGCTSGHFLCGVSRGSPRSLVATATFFVTALLTANFFPISSLATTAPAYELAFPKRRSIITLLWTLSAVHLAQQALSSYLTTRPNSSKAAKTLPFALNGLVFSLGLLISGMASPSKVLGFLKPIPPFQHFDPSLAMIVVSGVVPNALHWFNLSERKPRFSWEKWSVPSRKDIDWRLIVGSALFGAGWGLAGVCPGPAIVGAGKIASAIVAGEAGAMQAGQTISAYLVSMVGGMGLASLI